MANRTVELRFPLTTRITSLATNTTLGTATRHDFNSGGATNIWIPMTTRTIRAAVLEMSASDEFTVANDVDGIRTGIKINAVAFQDFDVPYTAANTGDHTVIRWRQDVTSYFQTNDPGTASFAFQVGVAIQTAAAANVTGLTAVLIVTVDFDESASTWIKSVCFLAQSHHTTIGTSYVEIGTTGGASNAPTNQIPQLTSGGKLTEASPTPRAFWADLHGTSNATGTDLTLTVRTDGATDNARYNVEQSLSSNTSYCDRVDLTGLDTTAAHALEMKSSAASTFELMGAEIWATYEFSPGSTTTVFNSVRMPLENSGQIQTLADSTAGDAERYQVLLDIQEPGTITMEQGTGVVLFASSNNCNRSVLASGQTARVYSFVSNLTRDVSEPIIHRCDHSSSTWTLTRGVNRLTIDQYASIENTNLMTRGGYAVINYTSSKSASGVGAHNHTIMAPVLGSHTVSTAARTTYSPTAPIIPETNYSLQGVFADIHNYCSSGQAVAFGAERQSGEAQGGGWDNRHTYNMGAQDQEFGTKRTAIPLTDMFRRSYGVGETDPERMNIETARDWIVFSPTVTGTIVFSVVNYITYHSNQFTVAGVVEVGGSPVANGKTVEIIAKDANGLVERIGAPTTTGGTGSFTLEVLDSTRDYRALYEDGATVGASAWATPESETFDIEIATGGGGGDVTPPVITIVSPTPDTNPGGGGGFSSDWLVARVTPIVIEITDLAPGNEYLCLTCTYAGASNEIVVYRRGAFRGEFGALSFAQSITNGLRLTILPAGGWPSSDALNDVTFAVDAIDGDGNLAA